MKEFQQIEIHDLSVSTQDKRFLLHCKGRYYEANFRIVELVSCLQNYDTQKEAVASYAKKKSGEIFC